MKAKQYFIDFYGKIEFGAKIAGRVGQYRSVYVMLSLGKISM